MRPEPISDREAHFKSLRLGYNSQGVVFECRNGVQRWWPPLAVNSEGSARTLMISSSEGPNGERDAHNSVHGGSIREGIDEVEVEEIFWDAEEYIQET